MLSDSVPSHAGITRLALTMLDQRISATALGEATQIPVPTISNYAHGRRQISTRHLPLIAIALGTTKNGITGWADHTQCIVVDDEWSDSNPFRLYRNSRPHSYPHNAAVHKYELGER